MLLLLALNAVSAAVTSCGGLFKPNSLQLIPHESRPGSNAMLRFKYTVPPYTKITDGVRQTSISYNFSPLPAITEPLCKNITCPIENGTYSKEVAWTWPNLSGTFSSTMKWFDPDTVLLLCVRLTETLNSRALTLWNSRKAH